MTLVILIIAAVISLVLGIATEVNSFNLSYAFFSCSFYAIVCRSFAIYAYLLMNLKSVI